MKATNNMESLLGVCFTTCFVLIMFMEIVLVDASRVFNVGDDLGWQQPEFNNSAFYFHWAQTHRFHVGDSLSFVYKNDSVIEVAKWGYYHCNASQPVAVFNNGRSVFKLDKPGPFYFISGAADHCKNGQRLVVEVMGNHGHRSRSPPSIASPPESPLAPLPQPSSARSMSLTYASASMVVSASLYGFLVLCVASNLSFSWYL